VAATNKPLEDEIRARRFRRDLYYRLNVFSISVPSLRERSDDILLLAQAFLVEAETEVNRRDLTLAPDAIAAIRAHDWPGNVRELRNVLLRAAATAPAPRIRAEDLVLDLGAPDPAAPASARTSGPLREVVLESERDALVAALDACGWNFARAADRLGVSRMTLYRRLRKCGVTRKSPGGELA
jgi:DNA-binding NtrC family response regulator